MNMLSFGIYLREEWLDLGVTVTKKVKNLYNKNFETFKKETRNNLAAPQLKNG